MLRGLEKMMMIHLKLNRSSDENLKDKLEENCQTERKII